jgi:NADPH:quinone reductase-like Zn-dependent oxidoreductase
MALLQEGKIKPVVGKVLPLSELKQAHQLLEGTRIAGNVFIVLSLLPLEG